MKLKLQLAAAWLAASLVSASAAEVFIYSNIDTDSGSFFPNGGAANVSGDNITTMVLDDITPATGFAGQAISNIYFSVINNNGVTITARPRIRMYNSDGSGGGPGTFIAGFSLNPMALSAGSSILSFHPVGVNVPSGTFWLGLTFDDNNGGTGASLTQLNNLGMEIYDPPTIGASDDVFFQTTSAGSFLASNPVGGQFFFGGNPVANFYFAVSVSSGGGGGNHQPVATAQSVTVPQNVPTAIILSATDADSDPLTYSVVTSPTSGTLSGAAPNLVYTPNNNFLGLDSFTFKANDGQTDSVPALVSLTVIPPSAGLIINPVWDATITSNPNAAAIMNTISNAILIFQSKFADTVTVKITYAIMNSGLGQSSTFVGSAPYSSFYSALVAHATSTNDTTALAHVPGGSTDPVHGGSSVSMTTPHLRALGFSASPPGGQSDSTISLNMSIINITRTSIDPSKYDLQAVVSHEMDEVLGTISGVGGANIFPSDLYRYTSSGVRNWTTSGDNAFFSIDTTTDLARYNQNSGGDYGDWWSTGAHTPQVQDAFGTPGATPNLGVELTVLDVVGWHLVTSVAAPAPVFQSVTRSGNTVNLTWTSVAGRSYQLQYKTNVAGLTWSNLGSPILASGSSTSSSDTITTDHQRFYHVGLLPGPGPLPPESGGSLTPVKVPATHSPALSRGLRPITGQVQEVEVSAPPMSSQMQPGVTDLHLRTNYFRPQPSN